MTNKFSIKNCISVIRKPAKQAGKTWLTESKLLILFPAHHTYYCNADFYEYDFNCSSFLSIQFTKLLIMMILIQEKKIIQEFISNYLQLNTSKHY